MPTLSIDLPERVLSALYQSPQEAEKDVRLAIAIEWYRRGAISQGRAAEIAGLTRADFIDELAARKIFVAHMNLEELKRGDWDWLRRRSRYQRRYCTTPSPWI